MVLVSIISLFKKGQEGNTIILKLREECKSHVAMTTEN